MTDLHVVLGAGPAGSTIVDELLRRGLRVRHVNRTPLVESPTETAVADVSDAEQAIDATRGAAAIYHAVNVPYHLQVDAMPGIGAAVLGAAVANHARLVVLDTLYPYGEADGAAITENAPWAATSRKGRMRADLDRMYLAAHEDGSARVVLGRSADFYGPRVVNSTMGGAIFPAVLTGQRPLVFGDIDLPHSYSFIPDVARGLVDLGTASDDSADGRVWHLPTVPAATTREVLSMIGELTGTVVDPDIQDGPTPNAVFDAQFMNEYAEMFYQHRIPQNMVSADFEKTFGTRPTPLRDGLAATLQWYREWLARQ